MKFLWMKHILYPKKSKMAGKKCYLCAYEKAHYYIINVYSAYSGCAERHVGAESPTSGQQGRDAIRNS